MKVLAKDQGRPAREGAPSTARGNPLDLRAYRRDVVRLDLDPPDRDVLIPEDGHVLVAGHTQ